MQMRYNISKGLQIAGCIIDISFFYQVQDSLINRNGNYVKIIIYMQVEDIIDYRTQWLKVEED